jgi:hypothetical protein
MAKERKLKEEQVKETTFSFPRLQEINSLINSLKNTNVGVESILNLMKLKAELKTLILEQNELIKELFGKKYELEITTADNGQEIYSYKGHEKEAEIVKDQNELMNREIPIKSKLNFMKMKEIVAASEGLPMGVVIELAEVLAEK